MYRYHYTEQEMVDAINQLGLPIVLFCAGVAFLLQKVYSTIDWFRK